jgi:hypothetical protein
MLVTMDATASADSPRVTQALSGVLRAKGFAVDDFEVEEESAPDFGDLLGALGGLLRVRCFSTGEERLYPTGSGSAWLGAFLMDLGSGLFARAARGPRTALG